MAEIIYSLPFPVLEEGNLSYRGASYEGRPETLKSSGLLSINHCLKEAPFLERLIDEGKARFGCLVVIPKTGYRKLEVANTGSAEQEVDINKDYLAEPPMIRPLLLSFEEINHEFIAEDGVANIWHGQRATIPKGARLARGPYLRPHSSIANIISFSKDEESEPNALKVISSPDNGFRFIVKVGADLYNFINRNRDHILFNNLHAFVFSRCLEILQKDYSGGEDSGEASWEQYPNLRLIAEQLREKKLPLWWEDVQLESDSIATQLYPIQIPPDEKEE